MKKAIYTILLLTGLGLMMSSCNKDNKNVSDIVGNWTISSNDFYYDDRLIEFNKLELGIVCLMEDNTTKEFYDPMGGGIGSMITYNFSKDGYLYVMGMKLAEQGAGSESVKPMERALKEMDKDFIHKVETLFPTLSRNDIRLMSLIRMELPSGEISKILNITMDSLHKSRYRLRKKLGLGGGQSLEAFINSI